MRTHLRLLSVISCSVLASAGLIGVASAADPPGKASFAGFADPVFYAVGQVPWYPTAADIDADGDLDIVTANGLSFDLSLLFNRGDGTFDPEIRIPTASGPRNAAIADFTGDGIVDIAVAFVGAPPGQGGAPGGVAFLPGLGGGTFGKQTFFLAGAQPTAIRAGDVDGDGDLDLVTSNQLSSDIAVLFNDGAGVFSQPALRFTVGTAPQDVELGDMDNDGDLDVVAPSGFSPFVTMLLNNGDGDFTESVQFPQNFLLRAFLDDIDGDGFLDIIFISASYIAVIFNPGVDHTAQPVLFLTGGPMSDVNAGLVDLDANMDAVGLHQGELIIPPPNGIVFLGDGAGQLVNVQTPYNFGLGADANILADLDGDGDFDSVTTNLQGVGVMMNLSISLSRFDLNGDGVVDAADLAALLQGWGQPGRADFDHSGVVDGADLANLLANWTQPGARRAGKQPGQDTKGPMR